MSGGFSAQSSGGNAGDIKHFAGTAAPAGWLIANGATVSRTAYAALFAVVGTTYGAGDGATTFALPDLRGEFIRGADLGRGVDSGRAVGSAQGHQFPSHAHQTTVQIGAVGAGVFMTDAGVSGTGPANTAYTSTAQGGTTNSSETRPRNVALLPCIKY